MKKLFTFLSLCLLSIAASAQEYVFTDAQGNTYDDGAVINRTEVEDDGFGSINLPGNLFIKNVGAEEGSQVAIETQITKIDNGALQICFPANCKSISAVETYESEAKASLASGEAKDLTTEWLPTEYGECIVTYTAKKYLGFAGSAVRSITVKYKYSNAQQNWWGYVNGNEKTNGVGVSKADTYHCAIFIPGDNAIAAGKTINAVRFGLIAPHATNAKVWVASELPVTVDASHTLRFVDVPDSKLGNEQIDIELPSPIEVSANGIYVGYSFTITTASGNADKYPVLFAGTPAVNTLLIKTDATVTTWSDLVDNNFGRLFLQVLLEGTFADNNASAEDFGTAYAALGGTGTATIDVTNYGGTPLSSIDYAITTDGETSAEQHADIATPIAFNATGKVEITIPADATVGEKAKTLNITKVNGNANATADKAINFTLCTLPELVERNVVVEEYTGIGCGWCPRGMIGMENLRNTYGDRFVGIAIHQYGSSSSDAMYIAKNAYANISFQGAPSCRIDRGAEIDPYYGSSSDIRNDFAKEMAIPAMAKINVSATIDENLKKVNAKANVETILDNSEYTIEFVVIGDGLKGTGSSWNQANYYIQYAESGVPEDLAIFASGGKYGTNPIKDWSFNDVALVSSYGAGVNKAPKLGVMNAGEQKEVEYTLTMPTKTSLKNAVKDAELYIVAMLVDKQKHIVNAAKAAINGTSNAIETVNKEDAQEVARYTLDGRRVNDSQKGLNIVRMANGKTVKVINK